MLYETDIAALVKRESLSWADTIKVLFYYTGHDGRWPDSGVWISQQAKLHITTRSGQHCTTQQKCINTCRDLCSMYMTNTSAYVAIAMGTDVTLPFSCNKVTHY